MVRARPAWNNLPMAWDSSRRVPWARLQREWLVYAVVMIIAFFVFLRDSVSAGSILGLAASYPLYLTFGAVLAKFGYQRKTFKDLRSASAPRATRSTSGAPASAADSRHRPRPTKRTSTGPSQHRPKNSRKRR